MSIQSEISRIGGNVSSSFYVLSSEGITVNGAVNSDDLPRLIQELAYRRVDCGLFGEPDDAAAFDCGIFGESDTEADFDCGTF